MYNLLEVEGMPSPAYITALRDRLLIFEARSFLPFVVALSRCCLSLTSAMRRLSRFGSAGQVLAILCGFSCLVLLASGESNYNTAGLQRHTHTALSWNYAHAHEWEGLCRTGESQSPISFVSLEPRNVETPAFLTSLAFSSRCHLEPDTAQAVVENVNCGIHLRFVRMKGEKMKPWDSCFTTDPVSGRTYRFVGIDFHVGAEHRFAAFRSDAEMHLKFRAADTVDTNITALYIAVPLMVQTKNATTEGTELLDRLLTDGRLPPPDAMTNSVVPRRLSLLELLPNTDGYFTYNGSVSQPPCSEGVRWVVFTTPISVSAAAYGALQESIAQANSIPLKVAGNARKPQPLNGRTILRYKGGESNWTETASVTRPPKRITEQKTERGLHRAERSLRSLMENSLVRWCAAIFSAAVVLGVMATVWGRWRRPAVVGINPRDLQPLVTADERRTMSFSFCTVTEGQTQHLLPRGF
eukprot:gene8383-5871_t